MCVSVCARWWPGSSRPSTTQSLVSRCFGCEKCPLGRVRVFVYGFHPKSTFDRLAHTAQRTHSVRNVNHWEWGRTSGVLLGDIILLRNRREILCEWRVGPAKGAPHLPLWLPSKLNSSLWRQNLQLVSTPPTSPFTFFGPRHCQ